MFMSTWLDSISHRNLRAASIYYTPFRLRGVAPFGIDLIWVQSNSTVEYLLNAAPSLFGLPAFSHFIHPVLSELREPVGRRGFSAQQLRIRVSDSPTSRTIYAGASISFEYPIAREKTNYANVPPAWKVYAKLHLAHLSRQRNSNAPRLLFH